MFLDCLIFLSENWKTSDKTFLIWKPGNNNRYCTGLCFHNIVGKPLFHFIYRWWLTFNKTILCVWASQVAQVVKNLPANSGEINGVGLIPGLGRSPRGGHGHHSSTLAWRIPWIEEPSGLQSWGSQRVGHNWCDLTSMHTVLCCRCNTSFEFCQWGS